MDPRDTDFFSESAFVSVPYTILIIHVARWQIGCFGHCVYGNWQIVGERERHEDWNYSALWPFKVEPPPLPVHETDRKLQTAAQMYIFQKRQSQSTDDILYEHFIVY